MPIISVGLDLTELESEARFRKPIILVQIELAAYGANPARTLYLATKFYEDESGQPWEELIEAPPAIDYGGDFLQTGWQPAAADFVVLDRRLPGQDPDETFADLLWQYEFTGARVWIRLVFEGLPAGSSKPTRFDGEITEWDDQDPTRVPFHAVLARGWTGTVPLRKLNLKDFPNAPSEAYGTPFPYMIGDWKSRRYLRSNVIPNTAEASDAGIARGAAPMLIVDSPTAIDLALPQMLISDRDIATSADNSWWIFEPNLGRLAGPGAGTVVNPAGGPALLTLNNTISRVAIVPIEIDPATTGTGGQELLREDKDYWLTGYASLDYDAAERVLRFLFPDVPELGTLVSVQLLIYYAKDLWTGTAGEALVHNSDLGTQTTQALSLSASTTFPSNVWQQINTIPISSTVVPDWSAIKNCYGEVNVKAAGQELSLYRAVLQVQYRAAAKIERPGIQREERGSSVDASGRRSRNDRVRRFYTSETVTAPDLVSFDHPLYWYGQGKLDESDGRYTGTASALIEHPADIAQWFLRDIRGVPGSLIETGVGEFGSFADARTLLPSYKMLLQLSKEQKSDRFLRDLGAQSLCWFRRRSTRPGAPFIAIPWDIGLSADYRDAADLFTFQRLTPYVREKSLRTFRTRISDVYNQITVNFDYDPRTRTFARQVFITDTDSRVYNGSLYTTDATRVAIAAASAADLRFGPRDLNLNLEWVQDPVTANSILLRMFDLVVNPRVGVRFDTWANAYDLEAGHRIQLGEDWDDVLSFPGPGSDGSWAGKVFTVTNVKESSDTPLQIAVEAVETTE